MSTETEVRGIESRPTGWYFKVRSLETSYQVLMCNDLNFYYKCKTILQNIDNKNSSLSSEANDQWTNLLFSNLCSSNKLDLESQIENLKRHFKK